LAKKLRGKKKKRKGGEREEKRADRETFPEILRNMKKISQKGEVKSRGKRRDDGPVTQWEPLSKKKEGRKKEGEISRGKNKDKIWTGARKER